MRRMLGPFSVNTHTCSGRTMNSYASGRLKRRGKPAGVPHVEMVSGNRFLSLRSRWVRYTASHSALYGGCERTPGVVTAPLPVWVAVSKTVGPNILRIYTDGRPHLADQWDTYTGDSVGHWEGDTLVFTTRALKGFRDKDVILDRTGLVLSDKAHVTTRIRRSSPDLLDVRMTIEDSVSLTKPWTVAKQFRKQPAGTRVYDYGCAENNRNPVDAATGKTLILAPDGTPLNK